MISTVISTVISTGTGSIVELETEDGIHGQRQLIALGEVVIDSVTVETESFDVRIVVADFRAKAQAGLLIGRSGVQSNVRILLLVMACPLPLYSLRRLIACLQMAVFSVRQLCCVRKS